MNAALMFGLLTLVATTMAKPLSLEEAPETTTMSASETTIGSSTEGPAIKEAFPNGESDRKVPPMDMLQKEIVIFPRHQSGPYFIPYFHETTGMRQFPLREREFNPTGIPVIIPFQGRHTELNTKLEVQGSKLDQQKDEPMVSFDQMSQQGGSNDRMMPMMPEDGQRGRPMMPEDGQSGRPMMPEDDEQRGRPMMPEDGQRGRPMMQEYDGQRGRPMMQEYDGQRGRPMMQEYDEQRGRPMMQEYDGQRGRPMMPERIFATDEDELPTFLRGGREESSDNYPPMEQQEEIYQMPMEGSMAQERPMEGSMAQERPMEGSMAQERPMEGSMAQERPMEGSMAQERPMEESMAQERPMEGSMAQERPMEGMIDQRMPEEAEEPESQRNPEEAQEEPQEERKGIVPDPVFEVPARERNPEEEQRGEEMPMSDDEQIPNEEEQNEKVPMQEQRAEEMPMDQQDDGQRQDTPEDPEREMPTREYEVMGQPDMRPMLPEGLEEQKADRPSEEPTSSETEEKTTAVTTAVPEIVTVGTEKSTEKPVETAEEVKQPEEKVLTEIEKTMFDPLRRMESPSRPDFETDDYSNMVEGHGDIWRGNMDVYDVQQPFQRGF